MRSDSIFPYPRSRGAEGALFRLSTVIAALPGISMPSAVGPVLLLIPSLFLAPAIPAQPAAPIKWSAIGNSITEGSGYPAKLQTLLGPAFQVENHGVSATTLLKSGNFPYWTKGKLAQAFAYRPQIVSVALGTNDSKPVNWTAAGKAGFPADVRAMADTLAGMPSLPQVMLCIPVPAFQKNGQWSVDGINDPVIKDGIAPILRQAAREKNLAIIDLHGPLESRGDLFSGDGVHPDAGKAGADSIAAIIYRSFKEQAIRVACIGNSITDNEHNAQAYPVKLNQRLGRGYYVLNAGHSGRTLLRRGDSPYSKSDWFKEVFKFQPHLVTIKLGTNDAKPYNWDAHKDEFVPDLKWLIDTLGTIPTKPRIVLLTPIPAWKVDGNTAWPYDINGDVLKNEVIPKIKQVAQERNLPLIDLYAPFLPYKSLAPDGVHPNAAGLDTLSRLIYNGIKDVPTSVRSGDGAAHGPEEGSRTASPDAVSDAGPGKTRKPVNPLAPQGVDAAGRRF
jgi:acyl-CoA thioesterase I